MELENMKVILLHHNWEYLEACCNLINDEWPRSDSARLHSLKRSCDNLPTSLILIMTEKNEELVLGHSKMSPINQYHTACFVESVVIAKKLRGRGLGRYLMEETEKYAKSIGKSVIFLSTSDKEEFYLKLGYCRCEPVSIYGCKNFQMSNTRTPLFSIKQIDDSDENEESSKGFVPPVPPPLPLTEVTISQNFRVTKVYMMKAIY